jgi:hypothetical protein
MEAMRATEFHWIERLDYGDKICPDQSKRPALQFQRYVPGLVLDDSNDLPLLFVSDAERAVDVDLRRVLAIYCLDKRPALCIYLSPSGTPHQEAVLF